MGQSNPLKKFMSLQPHAVAHRNHAASLFYFGGTTIDVLIFGEL